MRRWGMGIIYLTKVILRARCRWVHFDSTPGAFETAPRAVYPENF